MFGLSNFRLIAYGLTFLVIAGLYWRYNYVLHQRDAAVSQAAELVTALVTEKQNAAQVQADLNASRSASSALQSRLTDIESRHNQPPPRVRCYASVPGTTSEGGAAAGSVGTFKPGGDEGALRDAGPALDAARREAEVNAARYEALIEWERARSH